MEAWQKHGRRALHALDRPAAMETVDAVLGMSNVANWVTKFVKSVCGPWPCQKFNPDTRLKLTLPVPECFASRALLHTWCEAAFRHSSAALAPMCLENEDYVSIVTTVHTSELTKNKM